MQRAIVILLFTLTGCVSNPVISDINDSSLKVQQPLGTPDGDVQRKADEGCSLYGRRAQRISHVCSDAYCINKVVLFACRGALAVAPQPASSTPSSFASPPPATSSSPTTPTPASYGSAPLVPTNASEETIRQVQSALQERGFDPGPVDGQYTQATKFAVHDFQSRQGLVSNGTLDGPTLKALGIKEE